MFGLVKSGGWWCKVKEKIVSKEKCSENKSKNVSPVVNSNFLFRKEVESEIKLIPQYIIIIVH